MGKGKMKYEAPRISMKQVEIQQVITASGYDPLKAEATLNISTSTMYLQEGQPYCFNDDNYTTNEKFFQTGWEEE